MNLGISLSEDREAAAGSHAVDPLFQDSDSKDSEENPEQALRFLKGSM